jgi:hypothetical protein
LRQFPTETVVGCGDERGEIVKEFGERSAKA